MTTYENITSAQLDESRNLTTQNLAAAPEPKHQLTREGHIDQSLLAKDHFEHYLRVADVLAKSSLIPKGMQGRPSDVLIAMEMGLQIGIPMMQAIQDIAVINGRPALWGDGLLAVVQGHRDYEWIEERLEEASSGLVATCSIKRRNHEPHTVTFSQQDAQKAGLLGKQGTWSQYPKRMLQLRARSFCIRDIFADALRGVKGAEEVTDYPPEATQIKSSSDALKNILSNKPAPPAKGPDQTKALLDKLRPEQKEVPTPSKVHNTGRDDVAASPEQIDRIEILMEERNYTDDRRKKVLKYFKVSNLSELTEAQAVACTMKVEKS